MTPRPGANKRNVSVSKAAAILRAAGGFKEGTSVSALARAAGLPRATALRMIEALVAEEFLIRLRDRDVVLLGPALLDLAQAVQPDRLLTEQARVPMMELSTAIRESVTLGVVRNETILGVEEIQGPHMIGPVSWIGRAWPLHATASGRLLLNELSDEELDANLRQKLPRHTPTTITDVDQVRAIIRATGARRWGESIDELEDGLASIAAAIRRNGRIVAFITVSGPSYRFDKPARDAAVEPLLKAVEDISNADWVQPENGRR
ncbi:MAG: IclR family transcriptional regulator, acetate operon repressor [Gaiellales bacterium]|jgi:DNA-binding IclR family transcriptional regulator|nr:IclR family transcriptional regulator, acetate operon repressor [Gaiellales bacterium]